MFTFAEYLTIFFSFLFTCLLFYFPIKWFIKWNNLYKKNQAIRNEEKTKEKRENERYEYYLTKEGKEALMEYITKDELEEYDYEVLAKFYASENGQKVLMDKIKNGEE